MTRHEVTRSMMFQTAFLNRENNFLHNSYDKEQEPFHYMVNGEKENMLEAIRQNWKSEGVGKLSEDPLVNQKYHFVCTATIACRYCVEWGLDSAQAYNASDLYIQKMDRSQSREDILRLREDMMSFYCDAMAERQKQMGISLPVTRAIEYIDGHLHDKITLDDIAANAGVSRTYMSRLFHKETGFRLSEYIIKRRVEAAKNMLRYMPSSSAEIAEYVGFSNPSHFQRAFKQETGMTPNVYRRTMGNYVMHVAGEKTGEVSSD